VAFVVFLSVRLDFANNANSASHLAALRQGRTPIKVRLSDEVGGAERSKSESGCVMFVAARSSSVRDRAVKSR